MSDERVITRIRSYLVSCEGAPEQVEGTLTTGEAFYFRARHRTITLGLGANVNDAARDPHTVSLRLEGWDSDAHPLSCLDDPMPLVHAMIKIRAGLIKYAGRTEPPLRETLGQT
jgi:hypothetical protein